MPLSKDDLEFLDEHVSPKFKKKLMYSKDNQIQNIIIEYGKWICNHRRCDELRPIAECDDKHYFKAKFSDNYCIVFKPNENPKYIDQPFLIRFYLEK